MNLLEERRKTSEAIAKGQFVTHVLEKNAKEIETETAQRMASFDSPFWAMRSFEVSDNEMVYTNLKQHRFVDMKTRQTADGVARKKHYAIHNKPIFGHLNNIVRELMYGFTDAVKSKFQSLQESS